MKKLIAVLACASMMIALAGCGANSSNKNTQVETFNGITKTVTTTTKDGKTETETVYTDEDGKTLDAEEGEAAFEKAKAEVEGAAEELDAEDASMDASEESSTEESSAAETSAEQTTYRAMVTFVNDTDANITEMYCALADSDLDDAANMFQTDFVLEPGMKANLGEGGGLTYAADVEWNLKFVTEDGYVAEFDNFVFGTPEDPENIIVTFSGEAESYNMNIK